MYLSIISEKYKNQDDSHTGTSQEDHRFLACLVSPSTFIF